MRKLAAVVFWAACTAFATTQPIAISLGAKHGLNPESTTIQSKNENVLTKQTISGSVFEMGFFADFTFAEVMLGYGVGLNSTSKTTVDGTVTAQGDGIDDESSYAKFRILGKYPFDISGISLFPLAGMEYDHCLSRTQDGNILNLGTLNEDVRADMNKIWLELGAGADVMVSDKIFVRPEILLGLKLNSKLENDSIAAYNAALKAAEINGNRSIITLKGNFSVGFGYKL